MKEMLTEWIMNLTLFSLISSTITRLLPGKTYIPYIRIFCGIMMILTLFQPVFRIAGLENEMEFHFMEEVYETERKQIENEMIRIEEEQKAEWEKQYREYLKKYEKEEAERERGVEGQPVTQAMEPDWKEEEQPNGVENEDEGID